MLKQLCPLALAGMAAVGTAQAARVWEVDTDFNPKVSLPASVGQVINSGQNLWVSGNFASSGEQWTQFLRGLDASMAPITPAFPADFKHASAISELVSLESGDFLVVIQLSGSHKLYRLAPDGSLASGFEPLDIQAAAPAEPMLYKAQEVGNQLYLLGNFTRLGEHAVNFIGRLEANGNVDSRFDLGLEPHQDSAAWSAATDMFQLQDGTWLLGGGFETPNGERFMAQLSDGHLVNSFESPLTAFDENCPRLTQEVYFVGLPEDDEAEVCEEVLLLGCFQSPVEPGAYSAVFRPSLPKALDRLNPLHESPFSRPVNAFVLGDIDETGYRQLFTAGWDGILKFHSQILERDTSFQSPTFWNYDQAETFNADLALLDDELVVVGKFSAVEQVNEEENNQVFDHFGITRLDRLTGEVQALSVQLETPGRVYNASQEGDNYLLVGDFAQVNEQRYQNVVVLDPDGTVVPGHVLNNLGRFKLDNREGAPFIHRAIALDDGSYLLVGLFDHYQTAEEWQPVQNMLKVSAQGTLEAGWPQTEHTRATVLAPGVVLLHGGGPVPPQILLTADGTLFDLPGRPEVNTGVGAALWNERLVLGVVPNADGVSRWQEVDETWVELPAGVVAFNITLGLTSVELERDGAFDDLPAVGRYPLSFSATEAGLVAGGHWGRTRLIDAGLNWDLDWQSPALDGDKVRQLTRLYNGDLVGVGDGLTCPTCLHNNIQVVGSNGASTGDHFGFGPYSFGEASKLDSLLVHQDLAAKREHLLVTGTFTQWDFEPLAGIVRLSAELIEPEPDLPEPPEQPELPEPDPQAPRAYLDADADRVTLGESITLTADHDNPGALSNLVVRFQLTRLPAGSQLAKTLAGSATTWSITPDVAGEYTVTLLVMGESDEGKVLASTPVSLTVAAIAEQTPEEPGEPQEPEQPGQPPVNPGEPDTPEIQPPDPIVPPPGGDRDPDEPTQPPPALPPVTDKDGDNNSGGKGGGGGGGGSAGWSLFLVLLLATRLRKQRLA